MMRTAEILRGDKWTPAEFGDIRPDDKFVLIEPDGEPVAAGNVYVAADIPRRYPSIGCPQNMIIRTKATYDLNMREWKEREQLQNIIQIPGYDGTVLCCYCGNPLADADYTGKNKFAFKGWSEKDKCHKEYCWNCH